MGSLGLDFTFLSVLNGGEGGVTSEQVAVAALSSFSIEQQFPRISGAEANRTF
jgi:hypothetical protein